MLRQLFLSHDIGRSMDLYLLGMKHAPSVVIVSKQRSEYDYTPSSMSHKLSVAIIS